jgi:GTP cyclohydrolase I
MQEATELKVLLEPVESRARPQWRERPARNPEEFHHLVRRQLELLGENPDREGLQKTPNRVATSLGWLTRGYGLSAADAVGDAVFEETQ